MEINKREHTIEDEPNSEEKNEPYSLENENKNERLRRTFEEIMKYLMLDIW